MRFSIVTISFNQERFLRRCIESIAVQKWPSLEYIVVDAGSTDGSREVIASYPDLITKAIYESDRGPADGLNKGFAHATGDVFYYLNADDELLPDALVSVAEFLKVQPDVDVVLGHAVQIDQESNVVRNLYGSSGWSPYRYALGAALAIQQATFFRASAFNAAGGFNLKNRTCWDGELLVDMALAGAHVRLLNKPLGAFRVYPESITGSGRLEAARLEDRRRIATMILGREPGWRERCLGFLANRVDNVRHPGWTLQKCLFAARSWSRKKFLQGSASGG